MKALYSSKYYAGAVNTGLLVLRLGVGILILKHGYDKLANFNSSKYDFINFMHMGNKLSLALLIFAEFFCAILIIFGMFTRFACIPLIFSFCVALFITHNGDFFGKGEIDTLYLTGFVALLFAGPGRISVDRFIGR